MILAPTNRRIIRPHDKPSFVHTQRYGLVRGHPLGTAGGLIFFPIFNEGSGNEVFDLSRGNTGIFASGAEPTWASGKFGNALNFNSVNLENIGIPRIGNILGFDASKRYTWTGWIKGNADFSNFQGLFGIYSIEVPWIGFTVQLTWDGKVEIYNVNTFTSVAVSTTSAIGAWTHWAVTYDNGNVEVFINGVSEDTGSETFVDDFTHDSIIGAFPPAGGYLDGLISHEIVYNRALTAGEIALLYQEPFCMVQKKAAPVYFFVPTIVGENFVRTIDDGMGIADAMTRTQILTRTITDGVGSIDDMGRIQIQTRTLAESLGITDALWKAETKIFADAVGITDVITESQTFARVIADDIGLVDSVTKLMTYVKTLAEALGITDAVWKDDGRVVADDIGITDSITKTAVHARIVADAMGIVDDVTRTQVQLRTIADSLSLTDMMTPGQVIVFAEAIGMTDALTLTKTQVRVFTDSLGITDDVTRIAAYVFTQADDIRIGDAMIRVAIAIRTVSDDVGMTDARDVQHIVGGLVKAAWAFMIIRQTHN